MNKASLEFIPAPAKTESSRSSLGSNAKSSMGSRQTGFFDKMSQKKDPAADEADNREFAKKLDQANHGQNNPHKLENKTENERAEAPEAKEDVKSNTAAATANTEDKGSKENLAEKSPEQAAEKVSQADAGQNPTEEDAEKNPDASAEKDLLDALSMLFQGINEYLEKNPDQKDLKNIDFEGMVQLQEVLGEFKTTVNKILENYQSQIAGGGSEAKANLESMFQNLEGLSPELKDGLQKLWDGGLKEQLTALVNTDLSSVEDLTQQIPGLKEEVQKLVQALENVQNPQLQASQAGGQAQELTDGLQKLENAMQSLVENHSAKEVTPEENVQQASVANQGQATKLSADQTEVSEVKASESGDVAKDKAAAQKNENSGFQQNAKDGAQDGKSGEQLRQSDLKADPKELKAELREALKEEKAQKAEQATQQNTNPAVKKESFTETLKSNNEVLAAQEGKTAAKATTTAKAEPAILRQRSLEPHVLQQVGDKIRVMNKDGKQMMTLQLDPKDLGKIQLKMEMENKTMRVHMVVENEGVKNLMESRIHQLKEILESQNVQMDRLEVSVRQEKQYQERHPQRHRHAGKGNREEVKEDALMMKVEPGKEDTGRRLGYNTLEYVA